MNRRSFVAAVPALLPAIAAGQESTPQAGPVPESFLRALIGALFVDRSISDAVVLISDSGNGQDDGILAFADIVTWVNDRYEDEPLDPIVHILTSKDTGAVALLDLGNHRDVFVFVYIDTDSDGITGFRWSWTPY